MNEKINIAILDNNHDQLLQIVSELNLHNQNNICIATFNYNYLINSFKEFKIDVIVISAYSSVINYADIIRLLHLKDYSGKIIVVSNAFNAKIFDATRQLGAHAYCQKEASTIIQVINHILQYNCDYENNYYEQWSEKSVLKKLHLLDEKSFIFALNYRELQIIRKIAIGKTVEEISVIMALSPFTIDSIKKNLFQKTGTKNASHLIAWAFVHGIITADDFYPPPHHNSNTTSRL